MKKLLCLLLAVAMVFGLVACGNETKESSTAAGTTEAGTTAAATTEEEAANPVTLADYVKLNKDGKYGGALNICYYNGKPEVLDPMLKTGWGSYFWSQEVFEGPLARDAENKYQPQVCEFTYDEETNVLVLWVREGAVFHDGTAVEIEDVWASLERAQYVANCKTYIWDKIESHEIKDGKLTIKFSAYDSNTMYYLASNQNYCAVMPKEICEKYPYDASEEHVIMTVEDCIGTGPYKVDSWETSMWVKVVRFDQYVPLVSNATGCASTKYAYMDEIVQYYNTESASEFMEFMNDNYNMVRIDALYDEQTTAAGNYIWMDLSENNTYINYNMMNPDRPVANNADLRKAISAIMSIDEIAIHNCRTYFVVDYMPIVQNEYWSDAFAKADFYGAATQASIQKYVDAAFKNGYNGETLYFLGNKPEMNGLIRETIDRCKEYGINVEYKLDTNASKTIKKAKSEEFDMYYATSAVYELNPAGMAANMKSTFWKNETKDALFAELANTRFGTAESVAKWNETVQVWLDDCPITIMAHTQSAWTVDGDLSLEECGEGIFNHFWNAYWKQNKENHGSRQ